MPTSTHEHLTQAVALISRANTILILTHVPVDGDGLSSAIALFRFLRTMGKTATVICPEAIPEVYHFLPGAKDIRGDVSHLRDRVVSIDLQEGTEVDHIRTNIEMNRINIIISPKTGDIRESDIHFRGGAENLDLIITLDTPNKQLLGSVYEQNIDLFYDVPVINIDHHVENSYYGRVNLVDVSAASTTEILVDLMAAFPSPASEYINDDIATLLLSGLITDTMSFQNARTTPRSLHLASTLLKRGARQQEIIRHFYKTKNLSTLKLWGKILGNVEHNQLLRILWSSYSYQDLQDMNATEKEVNGIMDNLLCNAPGMEIILLFYERSPSRTYVYIKTLSEGIDEEEIALALATVSAKQNGALVLSKSLMESKGIFLDTLKKIQQRRLGISHRHVAAFNAGEALAFSSDLDESPPPSDPTLPQVLLPELEAELGRNAAG
jgi:phosphoesterase RecJ-like protein